MLDQKIKDLFPPMMKDTIDILAETVDATDEITVPTLLAVATFATQGLADASPLAWESCATSNYYCVLVPSGGKKTSILDLLLKGARDFEEDQRSVARKAKAQYKLDMKQYEDDLKKYANHKNSVLVPGSPSVLNPPSIPEEPHFPRGERYLTGKGTLNGIIEAMRGVPHFGIFNSDAAEFFNSHSHSDRNRSIEMISALSRLWSGEQIDKLTGMDNVVTRGKRTTALFMLQPNLAEFFVKEDFVEQGFIPRILVTQTERIAKKPVDFTDPNFSTKLTAVARLQPFNDRIYELLETVDKLQQNPRHLMRIKLYENRTVGNNSKDPNRLILDRHPVCMTDNTRKILTDFYNDMVEKEQSPEYEKISSFMARAYEHCIRIATVLSLFDKRSEVNERDAGCATGLMYYFIDQRMNLQIDGTSRIHPITACSRAVEEYLKKKHSGMLIDKTLLNNYGPKIYRDFNPDDRKKVIGDLIERDVLKPIGKKLMVSGLSAV